jgi:hypothetical protein
VPSSFLVFIELGVVEGHLNGSALLGQLVEAHAHFVERLAKIVIAPHRPAHLQQVLLGIELDARLFFVGTGGAIGQRTRTGIFPQGFEGILQLFKAPHRRATAPVRGHGFRRERCNLT